MTSLRQIVRGGVAGALSPGVDAVTLGSRFGHDERDPRIRALSAVPRSVTIGFEHGLQEADPEALHDRLALIDQDHRGFAYEGATMAAVILDAARGQRGTLTHAVMSGPGLPHLFLNYIGIGFAMARLPRFLWAGAVPATISSPYHPTLSWLAVDGYGFDRAFFHPDRYLERQERPAPYPWLGGQSWYFAKAVDQGVGRALWFACAGRVAQVADAIEDFAPLRRDDLWGGVGLAAAFAGQADDLSALVPRAGEYAPDVAVGAVLAATARASAGPLPSFTTEVLDATTGLTADGAAEAVDATTPDGPDDRLLPSYARWRDNLRSYLAAATDAPAGATQQR